MYEPEFCWISMFPVLGKHAHVRSLRKPLGATPTETRTEANQHVDFDYPTPQRSKSYCTGAFRNEEYLLGSRYKKVCSSPSGNTHAASEYIV